MVKEEDLEKAIEIARKHEGLFGWRNREECCVAACQDMAEWKRYQFAKEKQALIDKACEWMEPVLKDLDGYNCAGDLIRDFKKAMKGE